DDGSVDRQRHGHARRRPQYAAALPIDRVGDFIQTRVTHDFAGEHRVECPRQALSCLRGDRDGRNTIPLPGRWMRQLTIARKSRKYAAIEIERLTDTPERRTDHIIHTVRRNIDE